MNIIKLADLAVGSTVIFRYDDTSHAEFIVVHQGKPSDLYDDSCNGTWFMMKDMVDISATEWDSTDNDYENSSIFTLLNTTIYNRFDYSIQYGMKSVKLPYRKGTSASGSNMSGENGLKHNIFILSINEVGNTTATGYMYADGTPLDYFNGNGSRIGYSSGSATLWWTRSPVAISRQKTRVWVVGSNGVCSNSSSCTGSYKYRPCFVMRSDGYLQKDKYGFYQFLDYWYERNEIESCNSISTSTDENDEIVYNNKGYKENTWMETSTESVKDGYYLTGYIPYYEGEQHYLKNIDFNNNDEYNRISFFNDSKTYVGTVQGNNMADKTDCKFDKYGKFTMLNTSEFIWGEPYADSSGYYRISAKYIGPDSIITDAPLYMDEYQQLEYIETSGTQYFNTGVKPNQNSRVLLDVDIVSNSAQKGLLGSRVAYQDRAFSLFTATNNIGYQDDYGTATLTFPSPYESVGRHLIDKNKNILYVDTYELNESSIQNFSSEHPMFIMAINNAGAGYLPVTGKIYSCKIYDNDVLIRDFVPVAKGDVIGLYDKVNKKFYTNAGTGDLMGGNPVETKVDIPNDDENVETFPAEPTEYVLIDTYTTAQTWIAPEDGWYKVEVHGASGSGGLPAKYEIYDDGSIYYNIACGGSGAGGGYAASMIKLKTGDTITISPGAVGSDTTATFNSSLEVYDVIVVKSGGNGGNASANSSTGRGGAAGVAGDVSGGNIENIPGSPGVKGTYANWVYSEHNIACPAGGQAAHAEGNNGGRGGGIYRSTAVTDNWTGSEWLPYKRTFGQAGFIKISAGNTNGTGERPTVSYPVILNIQMDSLSTDLTTTAVQTNVPFNLSWYSYNSVTNYIVERKINDGEYEEIYRGNALMSGEYSLEETPINIGKIQYRVKATSGEYESEYLYTDEITIYKLSNYTNLIVGGVL